MELTLNEISAGLKSVGDLHGAQDTIITRVQTDSRLVSPGDLFICISGQKMDGHIFAPQAVQKGAAAIVSHVPMPDLRCPVLLVEDTVKALGRLANYWRLRKGKKVIAITGSAGKTTTKEMLAHVLGTGFTVGKNYKNWNNQIGLPLSILKMSGAEDVWVLELGINKPEDMDELAAVASPDWAVLLNVGPCHLEGLGTVQGVAASKSRMLDHMQSPARVFFVADYEFLEQEVKQRPHVEQVRLSCRDTRADYHVSFQGGTEFLIGEYGETVSIELPQVWAQYCENLVAVWAMARQWGLKHDQISAAIKGFRHPEQRFVVHDRGKWTMIDDTYNANPLSMARAVNSARELAGARDLYLVLGDMAELGNAEQHEHQELGRTVSSLQCKGIFFHGRNSDSFAQGLDEQSRSCFFEVNECDHFKAVLATINAASGVILFKGSRSSGMENYVAGFKEWIKQNKSA